MKFHVVVMGESHPGHFLKRQILSRKRKNETFSPAEEGEFAVVTPGRYGSPMATSQKFK
ncbi:hypothetical protein DAPPUDRAFT_238828 [Daphnia pulex]|uniref:Uncharacterized protein n=1 Tax=Daphnia pulex TaxID=6669 RepID=E9G7I3_DAPPU|nr:hypothetical protein DAPPUDRAFT_238828 [Daphnia pulex]|eukprot:EFX84637.1 hypothetical protein DAPPUDRAFT_238828 [Daphnia pulex]